MKRILKALFAFALAAFLIGQPVHLLAQTKATTQAAATASASWQKTIKEFTCDNLPLTEVAKILQEQFPGINFVIPPNAGDQPVPQLHLRSVSLNEIFHAIQIATHGKIQATQESDTMVSIQFYPEYQPPKQKKLCRAFSLSHYLANRSDKEIDKALGDVEKAFDRCWAMLSEANPGDNTPSPQLSLHRETKLLIVVGLPEQLDVVDQVVSEIERGAQPTFNFPVPPAPTPTRTLRNAPESTPVPQSPPIRPPAVPSPKTPSPKPGPSDK